MNNMKITYKLLLFTSLFFQGTSIVAMDDHIEQITDTMDKQDTSHYLSDLPLELIHTISLYCIDSASLARTVQNLNIFYTSPYLFTIFESKSFSKYFARRCADILALGDISLLFAIAVQNNYFSLARILLQSRFIRVNQQDSLGNTQLMIASNNYHLQAMLFLISHKANLEKKNNEGYTALEIIARQWEWPWPDNKQKQAVKILLTAGANKKRAKEFARTKGNPHLFFSPIVIMCTIQ